MGVLALEFMKGQNRESLGLTGHEVYSISGFAGGLKPRQTLKVRAEENGKVKEFDVVARVDTPEDVEYIRHGGVLPYVLRELLTGVGGYARRSSDSKSLSLRKESFA